MTHVVAVTNTAQRETLVKRIREVLTLEEINKQENIIVEQDRVNRIKIYHKVKDGNPILIKTILVLVINVSMNLQAVEEVYDDKILYDMHAVYEELAKCRARLDNVKESGKNRSKSNENYKGLADSLSGVYGEHGACGSI